MDNAFVAGAVERDHRMRITPAICEIVFGASKVTDSFLSSRGHELDWVTRRESHAVNFSREREHDRKAPPIVVDAWTDKPLPVATNREIGVARKYRVEMSADHHGRKVPGSAATSDDIPNLIGRDVRQAAIDEASGDPVRPFLLFAGWSRDLGDRDLRAQNRVVARRQPRVRGRQ